MTQPEKYKLVLYNVSSGIELTVSVRGADNHLRATEFLENLLKSSRTGGRSVSGNASDHYVVDDQQLAAFQTFMKQSMHS